MSGELTDGARIGFPVPVIVSAAIALLLMGVGVAKWAFTLDATVAALVNEQRHDDEKKIGGRLTRLETIVCASSDENVQRACATPIGLGDD